MEKVKLIFVISGVTKFLTCNGNYIIITSRGIVMKAAIIPIGNSRGIRIPKKILEECHIEKEVFMEVKNNSIIIKPVKAEPRKNWEKSFKKMRELNEDRMIIDDNIDLDMAGWEW